MTNIVAQKVRSRLPGWREAPNMYRMLKSLELRWRKFKEPPADFDVDREAFAKNPFIYTDRVTFEISKQCALACTHDRCPLWVDYVAVKNAGGNIKDYNASAKVLADDTIAKTLKVLGRYDFSGVISFHRYNEPLHDLDRFARLLALCKELAPKAKPRLWTNVSTLRKATLERFIKAGLRNIVVSAYTDKAFKEASRLRVFVGEFCRDNDMPPVPFEILHFANGGDDLDDRHEIYDRVASGLPHGNIYAPCSSPLRLLDIDAHGNVVLCCYDWKSHNTYGNVTQQDLDEILRESAMLDDYQKLMSGRRERDVCMACKTAREPDAPGAFGRKPAE